MPPKRAKKTQALKGKNKTKVRIFRESDKPRKNPDMVTRVIEDETILVPVYRTSDEINCIYTLNKVAAWVWEKFDGKTTIGQIKAQALKDFSSTPAELEREMAELLKDFQEIDVLK